MSLGCPGQPPAVPSPPATCITVSRSGNDGDCAQAQIDVKHAGKRAWCIWQLDSYSVTVTSDLSFCCWQCAAGVNVLLAAHISFMSTAWSIQVLKWAANDWGRLAFLDSEAAARLIRITSSWRHDHEGTTQPRSLGLHGGAACTQPAYKNNTTHPSLRLESTGRPLEASSPARNLSKFAMHLWHVFWYLTNTFSPCQAAGKAGVDYFSALAGGLPTTRRRTRWTWSSTRLPTRNSTITWRQARKLKPGYDRFPPASRGLAQTLVLTDGGMVPLGCSWAAAFRLLPALAAAAGGSDDPQLSPPLTVGPWEACGGGGRGAWMLKEIH